jgi:hypothetical protein
MIHFPQIRDHSNYRGAIISGATLIQALRLAAAVHLVKAPGGGFSNPLARHQRLRPKVLR